MDGEGRPARRLRPLRAPAPGAASPSSHRRCLDELKRQVEDGTYRPDPEAIARELVRRGLDGE